MYKGINDSGWICKTEGEKSEKQIFLSPGCNVLKDLFKRMSAFRDDPCGVRATARQWIR